MKNRETAADTGDVSDWDDSASTSPAVKLTMVSVLVVGVGALAFSWYTYQHQHTLVQQEHDARVAQVATLQREVNALRSKDSTNAARIQGLQTKQGNLAPLAKRVLKSVFTIFSGNELGSGFVAWNDDSSSYLITARHVVKNNLGGYVTLQRASGGTWQGEIQAEDAKNDLAVIRVAAQPAGADTLWQSPDANTPRPGDQLLLVGSPFGLEGTVTTGVVSRVIKRYIQTDAAANPGNSGGPAIDRQGHVVGVLVSGGGENLNFAVRIDLVCVKLRAC